LFEVSVAALAIAKVRIFGIPFAKGVLLVRSDPAYLIFIESERSRAFYVIDRVGAHLIESPIVGKM